MNAAGEEKVGLISNDDVSDDDRVARRIWVSDGLYNFL